MKHVLVVDDSGASLRLIKGWLEKEFKVSVASSAAMAMGALQNVGIPDLILLDYEMPVCSGPEFFKQLKEDARYSDIPVMFLTGRDDAASIEVIESLDTAGYLIKTSPPQVVIDSVRQFFAT